VSLGSKELLEDDRYVGLMTAAFCAGSSRLLDAVAHTGGSFPASRRQGILLAAIVAGLAAAGLSADERAEYLAYHRDWLVRWNIPDRERRAAAVAHFDLRLETMAASVEQVGCFARRCWSGAGPADAWGTAVGELAIHLAGFRGDPAYDSDPFTSHPAFPPLFKVFHNLANALGVGMLDEALTHHLVLRGALFPAVTEEVPA
jgi:hypothetical protein